MSITGQKIRDALAQVDALTSAATRASVEARKAHTALQNVYAETLTELARIRRELREIDADMTPVDPLSARATAEALAMTRRR